MDNRDLLFFCTFCKNKPLSEVRQITCDIPHIDRQYKKGETIAYHGSVMTHLYMLTQGRVRTEVVSESGLTLRVEELRAPYPLAAAFLYADDNRFPVDVVALEPCRVSLISKEAVEKQMALCPGFLRGFMAFSANRLLDLSNRLKIYAQRSIKAKVAYYVLTKEHAGQFDLGCSVTVLAQLFSVERPSLSRAIREMVQDGMFTYENGKGHILDYDALQDVM